MRRHPGRVDQPGDRHPGQPGQRLLPGEALSHLPGCDADTPQLVVGIVHDERLRCHGVQQVVGGGAGQAEVERDPSGGNGRGAQREVAQHLECCRCRWDWATHAVQSRIRDRTRVQALRPGHSAALQFIHGADHGRHRRSQPVRCRRRRPHGRPRRVDTGGRGRCRDSPRPHRRPRCRRRRGVRGVHRLRGAGHPQHPRRRPHPAAAEPDPLARRRQRPARRGRGGARDDAAAPFHPRQRPQRRPPVHRRRLRSPAELRAGAGGARVRQPRLLRGPRAALALRAGAHR